MPEVADKKIILTPDLAGQLAAAYDAFKNNEISQDFPLSESDLNGIFDALIQENPLWEIDQNDPDKYTKVVTHLRRINDPVIRETAVVPYYFEKLIEASDQSAAQRKAELELVSRRVKRDIEEMRTVYSAKPVPQQSVEQEQKAAVAEAEQIIKETQRIESIPERKVFPLRTPPKQDEEPAEASGEPKHVDEIRKWVNDGRLARILHAVRQADLPQEVVDPAINEVAKTVVELQEQNKSLEAEAVHEALNRALAPSGTTLTESQIQQISNLIVPIVKETQPGTQYFDIDQKGVRPSRPVVRIFEGTSSSLSEQSNISDQAVDGRKLARETESALYLLYFRTPAWQKLFGFGGKEDPRAQLENALALVETRYPNYSKQNAIQLRLFRDNIDSMLPPGVKIDEIHAIPQENLEEELQTFKSLAGGQLLELRPNVAGNAPIVQPKTIEQALSQTSQTSESVKQAARERALSAGQNLLSQTSIKLRNLFANPGLGWLRGALGIALGLGGIVLPVAAPLKLLMLFAGGSMGVAQLSHSPQAMSAAVVGASRAVDGLQNFAKLLSNLSFQPTKMAGWVLGLVIVLPIALLLLSYNKITNDQSIFVEDQLTSSATITESQYISLTKTGTPGQYSGSTFPFEAKYTITISAKEKNLSGIKATDTFSVFGRGSVASPTLPSGVVFPTSLAAGETSTVTFSVNLGQEYLDSVVTNNITITANVEGGPENESVSRSFPIIIGSPPSGCFVFEGTWPEDKKAQVISASAVLARFPKYNSEICKDSAWGSGVKIRYGGSKSYGGYVDENRIVWLYDRAFDASDGRSGCATYTIIHETGHVHQHKNSGMYQSFITSVNPPGGETYLTSYPEHLGRKPSEDYAESIAMYIKRTIGDFSCSGIYNVAQMESVSPKHYNFMQNNIK